MADQLMWFRRDLRTSDHPALLAAVTAADLASNNHGWQWVAGSGTDAAPYFRIFNPISQGQKFDPDGDYVRRYVPELAHLDGAAAHEPWGVGEGYAGGYPERIVDHRAERAESLARLKAMQDGRPSLPCPSGTGRVSSAS